MLTVDGIEFSDWLNDQMNARGWRAVDLANAANLPSATVVRILNGDRNAGPDAAVKIAKASASRRNTSFDRQGYCRRRRMEWSLSTLLFRKFSVS